MTTGAAGDRGEPGAAENEAMRALDESECMEKEVEGKSSSYQGIVKAKWIESRRFNGRYQ